MKTINFENIARLLQARKDVVFAVVFGSGRSGVIPDAGDLDLGVYFDPKPDGDTLIEFLVEVSESVDFDEIDYTDLRNADPILAYEAISGQVICKNDPATTAEFFSLVCREYEDVMYRLNRPAFFTRSVKNAG